MENFNYKVGIIGATGMVGQRFITLLELQWACKDKDVFILEYFYIPRIMLPNLIKRLTSKIISLC